MKIGTGLFIGKPVLLGGLAAVENFVATVTNNSIEYTWDEAGGADGYNLYFDGGSGFSKHNGTLITGTSYTISGLNLQDYTAYLVPVASGEEGPATSEITSSVTTIYEDFSGYSVGDQIIGNGWTWRYPPNKVGTTDRAGEVVDNTTNPDGGLDPIVEDPIAITGGKAFAHTHDGTSIQRVYYTWDLADDLVDYEVHVRVQSQGPLNEIRFFTRASGWADLGDRNGYNFEMNVSSNFEQSETLIRKSVNGNFTTLGQSASKNLNTEALVDMRFRLEGNDLKIKSWDPAGSEPAGWDTEVSDTDLPGGGWFGIYGVSYDEFYLDFVEITKL